jgi:hypothetical protein
VRKTVVCLPRRGKTKSVARTVLARRPASGTVSDADDMVAVLRDAHTDSTRSPRYTESSDQLSFGSILLDIVRASSRTPTGGLEGGNLPIPSI